MGLLDSIPVEQMIVPLKSGDKDSVIRELFSVLLATGKIDDEAAALKAIFDREALGSTGLTGGIAVPHSKCMAALDLLIAIGTSPEGIDFDAADGMPSKLFFLLLAPPDKSSLHIQALSEISRLSRSVALCYEIINARDSEELASLIRCR